MATIYESENFMVESKERPFISRTEGGHLCIISKNKSISDRTQLSPKVAVELMKLSMIIGKAMEIGFIYRGIPIMKINYQEMGNWSFKTNTPNVLHIHIFGRAKDAKYQPHKEAVYLPDRSSGFYNDFAPLNQEDVAEIKKQIEEIRAEEKYKEENWSLQKKE